MIGCKDAESCTSINYNIPSTINDGEREGEITPCCSAIIEEELSVVQWKTM